jgi:hypothetical protein
VALTKASGFRKCERLACLESGARAALAAAKEAVAEASGFAKKSRAFLLIERLIFVTSRLFCLEIKPHFSKAAAAFLHAGNKAAAAFKKRDNGERL